MHARITQACVCLMGRGGKAAARDLWQRLISLEIKRIKHWNSTCPTSSVGRESDTPIHIRWMAGSAKIGYSRLLCFYSYGHIYSQWYKCCPRVVRPGHQHPSLHIPAFTADPLLLQQSQWSPYTSLPHAPVMCPLQARSYILAAYCQLLDIASSIGLC